MALNPDKLKHVRPLDDGSVVAQCPACNLTGLDGKGNHLRLYPDGRYGCCVHPGDKEHRRTVHSIAGLRKASATPRITVHVAGYAAASARPLQLLNPPPAPNPKPPEDPLYDPENPF